MRTKPLTFVALAGWLAIARPAAADIVTIPPDPIWPVLVNFTISLTPNPPPIFPQLNPQPPPIIPQLTGQAQFFLAPVNTPFQPTPPPIDVADIGTLLPGGSFHGQFSPTDPCLGAGTCQLGFSFSGLTAGPGSNLGPFQTLAFPAGVNPAQLPPGGFDRLVILTIGSFDLSHPLIPPDPIRANGELVVFDDPEVIGTWQLSVIASPVPEPGTELLLAIGLIGLVVTARAQKLKPHDG